MKVIKEGVPQKAWEQTYLCTGTGNDGGGCKAVLLVERDDLFITASHCRDEVDYFVTFKCPCCESLTDIPDAPGQIRNMLIQGYRDK